MFPSFKFVGLSEKLFLYFPKAASGTLLLFATVGTRPTTATQKFALVPKLQLGNPVSEALDNCSCVALPPASIQSQLPEQLTTTESPQSNRLDRHNYAHWNNTNVPAGLRSPALRDCDECNPDFDA